MTKEGKNVCDEAKSLKMTTEIVAGKVQDIIDFVEKNDEILDKGWLLTLAAQLSDAEHFIQQKSVNVRYAIGETIKRRLESGKGLLT